MTDKDERFDIECAAGLFSQKNHPGVALAMAYVPWQEWGELYDEEKALCRGPLFPGLDKPSLGRKQVHHG